MILYQVRIPAISMFVLLGLAIHPAFAQTQSALSSQTSRTPQSDLDRREMLENMIWYHDLTHHEISRATGWTFSQIDEFQDRFDVQRSNRPSESSERKLTMLPYPGGRHPRIGFLDGAVDPQRETKLSVFTPWDRDSYVVADVPEAIWSNLGLTYLAHTHVETIWESQGVRLPTTEWQSVGDGSLETRRELPNGITFATLAENHVDSVRFRMSLTNGTDQPLSGLRVQNCVMLKGARGFEDQTNDNKLIVDNYAVCRHRTEKRYVITAWSPLHRCWANERCPCLHSDPVFPDCNPGETVTIRGWLSFYEGDDLIGELERIRGLGWDR